MGYPKKKLGQHFIFDRNLLSAFADASGAESTDHVLEIGVGEATLTRVLAERVRRVTAFELDRTLEPRIRANLAACDNVTLRWEDFLKADLSRWPEEDRPDRVVANLPYYISSDILKKLLRVPWELKSITVLVQKEMAERMAAEPGSKQYGALSALCRILGGASILMTVPPSAFVPPPHVDSALLHISRAGKPYGAEAEAYRKLIDACFANRRKQLGTALPGLLSLPRETVLDALEAAGIDRTERAEQLDSDDFTRLLQALGK